MVGFKPRLGASFFKGFEIQFYFGFGLAEICAVFEILLVKF